MVSEGETESSAVTLTLPNPLRLLPLCVRKVQGLAPFTSIRHELLEQRFNDGLWIFRASMHTGDNN